MPKVSVPQQIIKLTEGILSAQYCQYIFSAIQENLFHQKLELGFNGFLNDDSNEPATTLTQLDLVHTEIVNLLDAMHSLQNTPTQDIFVDCIHYFKTLESILPNMSAEIFHIAFHVNQYLSEEMGVLDPDEIMNLFSKNAYPQQPINMNHLDSCGECTCSNKLDQAMFILVKLANDIPSPSFSWVFQGENCKAFFQEVQRLYSFRRTFESTNSFQEHNYSFYHANSNRSPKYNEQNHDPSFDDHPNMPRMCSRRSSQEDDTTESSYHSACTHVERDEDNQNYECLSRSSVYRVPHPLNSLCDVKKKRFSTSPSQIEDAGARGNKLDINTQTDFDDSSDCESLDTFESGVVKRVKKASNTLGNCLSSSPCSSLCDEGAYCSDPTMLRLSQCSDMDSDGKNDARLMPKEVPSILGSILRNGKDVQTHSDEIMFTCNQNFGSENCELQTTEISLENGINVSSVHKEVSSSLDTVLRRVESMQSDPLMDTAFTSSANRDCEVERESIKRPPKRMLVVYVEKLNVDKWLSDNLEKSSVTSCDESDDDNVSDSGETLKPLSSNTSTLLNSANAMEISKASHYSVKSGTLTRQRRASSHEITDGLDVKKVTRRRRFSAPGACSSCSLKSDTLEVVESFPPETSSEISVPDDRNAISESTLNNEDLTVCDDSSTGLDCRNDTMDCAQVEGNMSTKNDCCDSQSNGEQEKVVTSEPHDGKEREQILDSSVSSEERMSSEDHMSVPKVPSQPCVNSTLTIDSYKYLTRRRKNSLDTSGKLPRSPSTDKEREPFKSRKNNLTSMLCKRCNLRGLCSGSYSLRQKWKRGVSSTAHSSLQNVKLKYGELCVRCGQSLKSEKKFSDKDREKARLSNSGSKTDCTQSLQESCVNITLNVSSDECESRTECVNKQGTSDSSSSEEHSQEEWLTLPAKRCRPLLPSESESEGKVEASQSPCSRLSSLSSNTSCSTDQFPRVKHKLYTGAADKIMAISRRRLVEDALLLDSEIKCGPKAQRIQKVVKD